MMNTLQNITTLKEQGVADKNVINVLKLKGEKEEDIISNLNSFYENKNATQVTEDVTSSFPLLQIIILILLMIIAGVLGLFIFQG